MTTVVVSVDGSEGSRHAVNWCAAHLAPQTRVIAVCGLAALGEFAIGLPPFDVDTERRIEESFERDWCADLRAANLDLETRFVHERQLNAVRDVARAEEADSVVVSRHKHSLAGALVADRPVRRLIQHLDCPVVVIPAPTHSTPETADGSRASRRRHRSRPDRVPIFRAVSLVPATVVAQPGAGTYVPRASAAPVRR